MPMQSRTDQIHSYEFFLQRVISGLVSRESDPAELPFRRLGWSGFGSVMVTVIVAGVVAVVGMLIGGGNDAWRDGDSIIQVRGSETIYVYEPAEERLYPMANLVSAQLYTDGAEVVRVSARSLSGVARGPTLGIVGAPDLPGDGDDLLTGGWSVCSQRPVPDDDDAAPVSVVGVGRSPAGGRPIGEEALVVRVGPDGPYHLVWHGYSFEIDNRAEVREAVLSELDGTGTATLPVSQAWLDALPSSDRLTLPPAYVDNGPIVLVDGERRRVGQVIRDGAVHYLVLAEDQVTAITTLEAEIVNRLPGEDPVDDRLSTGVERVPPPSPSPSSPPRESPAVVTALAHGGSACAVVAPGEFVPTVVAAGRLEPTNATPGASRAGTRLADFVSVAGGRAVLVRAMSAPAAPDREWHIVNDQGIQYPLPAPDVAGALGFPVDRGVRLPSGLVNLLMPGPTLSPEAARDPVPVPLPATGGPAG